MMSTNAFGPTLKQSTTSNTSAASAAAPHWHFARPCCTNCSDQCRHKYMFTNNWILCTMKSNWCCACNLHTCGACIMNKRTSQHSLQHLLSRLGLLFITTTPQEHKMLQSLPVNCKQYCAVVAATGASSLCTQSCSKSHWLLRSRNCCLQLVTTEIFEKPLYCHL